MREALLSSDVESANETVAKLLRQWPDSSLTIEDISGTIAAAEAGYRTAILCRNNGEAEYISTLLRRGGVPHALLRSSFQPMPLDRWIGDMLWDYCEPWIEKDDFIERYRYRVKEDAEEAEERFYNLCEICGIQEREHVSEIKMEDLGKVLEPLSDIPPHLRYSDAAALTVATIHKAKGREFDKVYLVKSAFDAASANSEEARIRYVAVTRAKEDLEIVGKRSDWFCRHISSGRCLHIELRHRNYKRFMFCENLTVGLPGDVDPVGFVDESLGNPIEMQNYITQEVHVDDPVELLLDRETEKYRIYHGGRPIGLLSDFALQDFRKAVSTTDNGANIPSKLDDVYVSNIVTIVQKDFSERIPSRFRESKMWLGIEITGFARTSYSDSRK
jgi:hypothetical protein